MRILNQANWGRGLAMGLALLAQGAAAQPVSTTSDQTTQSADPSDRLAANLVILSQNPKDVTALTEAGLSAIAVGDGDAALAFLALHSLIFTAGWLHQLSTLAAVMHGRRVATTASQAPAEDTLFMVMLVSLALFGEGVLGASVLDSAGLARDADARERFHAWIVRLVEAHLHGPGLVAEPTVPTRAAARRSGPRRKP